MTRFDTDPNGVRANASHRAGRASHQANLRCLGHSATIAFANGPAVEWLLTTLCPICGVMLHECDTARCDEPLCPIPDELFAPSTRDGSEPNKPLPVNQ